MKQRVRLTIKQEVDIIHAYVIDLEPMISSAARYGITRQGVFKLLKRQGIDTTKHRIPVSCSVCGVEIMRTKARIRKQKHHFCSQDCYFAFLETGNGNRYIESRYGGKVARTIVNDHFALQDGHIVHHEDRNQANNRLDNLRVFTNQGDHLRYHRGFDVMPIWDGRYA